MWKFVNFSLKNICSIFPSLVLPYYNFRLFKIQRISLWNPYRIDIEIFQLFSDATKSWICICTWYVPINIRAQWKIRQHRSGTPNFSLGAALSCFPISSHFSVNFVEYFGITTLTFLINCSITPSKSCLKDRERKSSSFRVFIAFSVINRKIPCLRRRKPLVEKNI